MRTVAVLPVKRFGQAKQRLAPSLPAAGRVALAEAMLRDVLLALARAESVERTLLVTGEPRAAAVGAFLGGEVVDDERDDGQSAAAALGIARALALGAPRTLLVPGDCPALDPGEVDALLAAHRDGVTVVPDRHGTGTNALVLSPPDAIAPAFGPGSRARHLALAAAAGVPAAVRSVESLAYDVDTGDDLVALRAELERRAASKLATVAALEGIAAESAAGEPPGRASAGG
jgi:2-phospho-L-lactate guanylyltransferase